MTKTTSILLAITVAIGLLRFTITPRLDLPTAEGSYEAVAHLFVGGLFGAWAVKRSEWAWLAMAVGVSLLELVLFFVQKAGL